MNKLTQVQTYAKVLALGALVASQSLSVLALAEETSTTTAVSTSTATSISATDPALSSSTQVSSSQPASSSVPASTTDPSLSDPSTEPGTSVSMTDSSTTTPTVASSTESSSAQEQDTDEEQSQPLYRLYHPGVKVHLYTLDKTEYQLLGTRGWKQEGVAWQVDTSGRYDKVYRLYNPGLKVHLYTKDSDEYASLATRGWNQEGVAFYSHGGVPIYRLYHPGVKRHLYTKDINEYTALASKGWNQEGVAFYGLGSSSVTPPPSSTKPSSTTRPSSTTPPSSTKPSSNQPSSGKLTISKVDAAAGTIEIVISEIKSSVNLKAVEVPVWSEQGGQDDIKWYSASKQSDGTYKVIVNKADHKNNVGTYHAHLYFVDQKGKKEWIAATKTELPQVAASATLKIQNKNVEIGTFDIVVSNIVSPNGLSAILVPVWSDEKGQDDIIWYEATKQANGTYKVTVSASRHGYSKGDYHVHLYLKEPSGSNVLLAQTKTSVTWTKQTPHATLTIQNVNHTYGFFDVVISNLYAPYGIESLKVPVWSEQNGQDDIVWYDAHQQTDGTYRVTVRAAGHKYDTGRYHAHLYLNSNGVRYGLGVADTNLTFTKRTGLSFIDVSSHNGFLSVSDYQNLISQGVSGVVVKLTEGTSYRNPFAEMQIKNAQLAGLKVSVYHYSHFTSATAAQAEARYFIAFAKELGLSNNTLMVNDIEEYKTRTNINNNMKAWEAEMKRLGYHNLIHYTGASWIDVNNLGYTGPIQTKLFGLQNFWVAHYPYVNGMALSKALSLQYHNQTAAWQFTSKASLLVGRSFFDLNIDYTGRFTH